MYSLVDSKIGNGVVALDHTDEGPLCGISKPIETDNYNIWQWSWRHRQDCHKLSWTESNKRREADGLSPRPLKSCRSRRYGIDHCECFSRKYKLYNRLRTWMPRGLNYCGHCDRFTKRKRQHKGQCKHLASRKMGLTS